MHKATHMIQSNNTCIYHENHLSCCGSGLICLLVQYFHMVFSASVPKATIHSYQIAAKKKKVSASHTGCCSVQNRVVDQCWLDNMEPIRAIANTILFVSCSWKTPKRPVLQKAMGPRFYLSVCTLSRLFTESSPSVCVQEESSLKCSEGNRGSGLREVTA